MKDRTKEIVKDGFASLVNNAAAMRGAKNGPLWLTIVMFILSVFLPVIPIFVSGITTNGDSFLKSYSYGLDRYATKVALDMQSEGFEFGISKDHLLSITKNGNEINYEDYGIANPAASYIDEVTGEYTFRVYLTNSKLKDAYTAVNEKYYAVTTTEETTYDKNNAAASYRPSYIILTPSDLFVVVNKGSKAVASSYTGDYKTIKEDNAYLAKLLTVKDKEGNEIAPSMVNTVYTDGVFKNFKKFLCKSYETLRIKNTFGTSGIYLAIFFGLSVVMGFLMWILTRGKNNPNNYFTPWLTMKIQARLGLAPALITLIVGFFLTSYAAIIYIVTLGLRAMWISMKELRPIAQ